MEPNTSAQASSVRAQLQIATRHLHDAVEAQLPLGSERLSVPSYTQLLEKLSALYGGLEQLALPHVPSLNALGLDWARRRKLPWIAADLRTLNATPAEPLILEPWDTSAHALGALYVLEGATLGGQIITRRLKQSLALTPAHGASFFASYGPDVGPMWRRFCAALEDYVVRPEQVQQVTAEAIRTFRLFLRYTA